MAKILRADGTEEDLQPPAAGHWRLEDLQAMVGGYVEVLRTIDGRWLVVDEEGKQKGKSPNRVATKLYIFGSVDPVVGTAVLVDTRFELDGPEDVDDESEPEAT